MKNTKLFFVLLIFLAGTLLQAQDRVRRSRTEVPSAPGGPTADVNISFGFPSLFPDNQGRGGDLLLSEQGTIVLSDVSFTRQGDRFESLTSIQAVSSDGQLLWETNLDNFKNQVTSGKALSENLLLLVLHESNITFLVGDSDLGQLAGFDPLSHAADFSSTLVCLDLGDGSLKWSTDWQGSVHNLQAARDGGWLLQYSRIDGDQIENRLAFIDASGTVNWDLTTKSHSFDQGG